jgi:hypothetical protein
LFSPKLVAALAAGALTLLPVDVASHAAPDRPATVVKPAATTSRYDTAVLADAPLFYWPLDESAGQVRDLTGHAAPSSVTTAQLGVPGATGTGVAFDGSSQQIQVPYTASMRLSGSFSAEVWAKLPATPQTSGWPTIFSDGNSMAGHFGSAMWVSSDSTHTVSFKRNGYDVSTVHGLTSTAYRHLVLTFDATTRRWTWYVDGAADSSGTLATLNGTDTESVALAIGVMLNSAGVGPVNPGKLMIDGLALYNRALPAVSVSAHFAAGKPATTAPAPPVAGPVKGYLGGVALGALQPWNSRRAADFQAMRAANATWVRSDLGWEYLEPVKGDWRFGTYDPVIADAKAAGLRYLAILHTVPGWANKNAGDYAPPTDLSLLTNYCYQTARHYLPLGVTDYEIGNEVNLPHPGWANPTGTLYTRGFLQPCVAGLRRAQNEVGIRANVLFGSMAPIDWTGGTNPLTFLTDAYSAGAGGQFDAVGWHPYTGSDAPATSPHMNADTVTLNGVMAMHGDGAKKIWATEYGAPTGGPYSITEAAQATLVPDALRVWYSRSFDGPLFWYSGRDTGTDAGDREQHFGLLRFDGTAKPAYSALTSQFTRG